MSEFNGTQIAPNWFEDCELSAQDLSLIIGKNPDRQQASIDQFNMLATYLTDKVGIYPHEIREWLYSGMRRLDGSRPIDVLHDTDGFDRVFDEAVQWHNDTYGLNYD